MRKRSPARWLAPLTLIVAALAIYLVVDSELGGSESSATGSTSTSTSTSASRTTTTKKKGAKAKAKTYTVKPGDVLSAIAEKTGVPLERLRELNPEADANALRTGQKLKLAPASQ